MIRKVDVSQVIRVPRVFEDKRKETHSPLISRHPMWILAVGFSRCNNTLSVVCELTVAPFVQKLSEMEENCFIFLFKLGFSPNSENVV